MSAASIDTAGGVEAGSGLQPQIGAEDIALGGALAHEALKIVREAREEALHAALAAIARALGVIKQDEIDVARIVELEGAELAHAQDDEAAAARRIGGIGELDLARVRGGAQQMPRRQVERQLGKAAEARRDPFERPERGDVGECYEQRHAALGVPQRRHEHGLVEQERARFLDRTRRVREGRVEPVGQQALAGTAARRGSIASGTGCCRRAPRAGDARPRPPRARA